MSLETQTADPFEDDATVLAALEAMEGGDAPSDEVAEPEAELESSAAEAEEAADTEPVGQEESTDASSEEEGSTAETENESESDAELQKRLSAIQQAEERQRAAIDSHREESLRAISEKEASLEAKLKQVADFDQLRAQAAYDPVGALNALGLAPESYEAAARMLWLNRPGAEADPGMRDAVQRTMRERKQSDSMDVVRKELAELKAELSKRDEADSAAKQQAVREETINAYLSKVETAVGEETPLVRNYLTSSPERARKAMRAIADKLADEYQSVPDPAAVAKQFEKERREELKALGIDPDLAIEATMKKQNRQAGETKAAKTLTPNLGTTTKPRSEPQTEEELDAELIREMENLE